MRMACLSDVVENRKSSYGKDLGEEEASAFVIKVSNVSDQGEFHSDFEERSFSQRDLQQLAVQAGDLCVVKSSGSKARILSGKTAIVCEDTVSPLVASNFCFLLRPNQSLAEPRYLWRVLNSPASKAFIKTVVAAFTYPNLNWSSYSKFRFPLPPLPEQKRIAAILDAADALRTKRRDSIEQLDSLVQATFLEMFGDPVTNPKGWDVSAISSCVDVLSGYAFKSSEFKPDGVPLIRISNLKGSSVNLAGCARIPEPKQGHLSKYRIQAGDTLIAMSGATTGKLGFVPADLTETWYLNQRVGLFRLRRDSKIRTPFLRAVLSSSFYQRHVWQLAAGVAQPNISAGQLESAFIPVAPLDLQTRFASIVESIEHQKSQLKTHLAELDTLFASLQSRAFNGELVA